METDKLHIVYATDERYLVPTRVAAASAVYHASRPQDLVIDILDCEISDSAWKKFETDLQKAVGNRFCLVRHRVDMSVYEQYKTWHTSRGIYARLSIPEILSDDVEWCVYADGDTLFVTDPFELETIYNSRYALMGHLDQTGRGLKEWYDKNGFVWDGGTYLCAGFIALNLKWAREHDLSKQCFEIIRQHPDIPYNDQDVLNILCAESKAALPAGWGVFANEAYWRVKPCCIHYVGERPWELPRLRGVYLPDTSRLWFDYARRVCGIRLCDMGLSRRRYFVAYLLSRVCKLYFRIVSLTRSGANRYSKANGRFLSDCKVPA